MSIQDTIRKLFKEKRQILFREHDGEDGFCAKGILMEAVRLHDLRDMGLHWVGGVNSSGQGSKYLEDRFDNWVQDGEVLDDTGFTLDEIQRIEGANDSGVTFENFTELFKENS